MKLMVTAKAKRVFRDSTDEPYMRVGARPGGCSGYIFTIGSDTAKEKTDSLYENFLLIDTEMHENIIGDVLVDYRDDNFVEQGFTFKRMGTGQICGCGESFTPLKETKQWRQKN